MSNIDYLRFLIDDNDIETQKFTDDELQSILDMDGNMYKAAATACQALAASYATKKKITARGVSVENQQVYEHYINLANSYKLRAENGDGYISSTGDGTNGSGLRLPFSTAVVTGVSRSEIREAQADPDRIKDVFPKPISDV